MSSTDLSTRDTVHDVSGAVGVWFRVTRYPSVVSPFTTESAEASAAAAFPANPIPAPASMPMPMPMPMPNATCINGLFILIPSSLTGIDSWSTWRITEMRCRYACSFTHRSPPKDNHLVEHALARACRTVVLRSHRDR